MKLSLPQLIAAALIAASPWLMGSSCATGGQAQGQAQEFAADYCDELLPQAQEQMEQSYRDEQQADQTDRISTRVTGPFGESIEMEIEVESGTHHDSAPSEPEVVETGLSDLVLNCGTDALDDRTCAVEVYMDSELIGRGNFQTQGQLAMRCLPAGQRELRIVDIAGGEEIYRDVITLYSDREYMAQVVEESPTETNFELYGESDISHGFTVPVDDADTTTTSGSSSDAAADADPMADGNFRDLSRRVEDETFSSDQKGLITDALASNYFTSRQAAELIAHLSSSMDQEELAIEFYDRIVDPGQFHVVIDAVDSSISRDNVRDAVDL